MISRLKLLILKNEIKTFFYATLVTRKLNGEPVNSLQIMRKFNSHP